jgi:hypothetical protein
VDELTDDAVHELVARWSAKKSPNSELHVHHVGGAMAQVAPDQTAYSHRSSPYLINVIARAVAPEGFDAEIAWARSARSALSAYGPDGMYVNFTGDAEPDKVRASYPPETYRRLVEVKRRYDPTNMFRLNQNISPDTT